MKRRNADDAVQLAQAALLPASNGRLSPEEVLLGHYFATECEGGFAITAYLPDWCGVNSGVVFATVLVSCDETDDICRIDWADFHPQR